MFKLLKAFTKKLKAFKKLAWEILFSVKKLHSQQFFLMRRIYKKFSLNHKEKNWILKVAFSMWWAYSWPVSNDIEWK